jgi:hypothetical protein
MIGKQEKCGMMDLKSFLFVEDINVANVRKLSKETIITRQEEK